MDVSIKNKELRKQAIKLVEVIHDVDLVIEAIPPMLYNRVNDLKLANAMINQSKMKILLDKIQRDWNSISDKKEIQILSEYVKTGMVLNVIYICSIFSALISCMLLPLAPMVLDIIDPLNESRPLKPLFMVEFFIDQEKYYYTLLAHAYSSALLSPIPLIAMDTFYMNCIYHICGMITILGTRINTIFKDENSEKILYADRHKVLNECIYMHQRIFDFCDDINNAYSTSFLFILFLNMTLMSFTGVAAVIKLDDFSQLNDTIRFSVFTIAQIYHLFCFNYMGQNLLNAMEQLGDKIYDCQWYKTPIKTQEMIMLMILRNDHPTIMQAVLFPLCLPTFTSVMKTSMSYFTVLKSTR